MPAGGFRKMKNNQDKTGLIHIYCGDGKGKTSAAVGLCVRAAGYGYKVLVGQFMKDSSGNERRILETIPEITLMPARDHSKFTFRMSEEEKKAAAEHCLHQLKQVEAAVQAGDYDLVFLDEVLYAVSTGLLEESALLAFLSHKPDALEVVLTGRNPGEAVTALADYVSEIRKIKHPYEKGIGARPGIEY